MAKPRPPRKVPTATSRASQLSTSPWSIAVPVITRAITGAGLRCTSTLLPAATTTASSQATELASATARAAAKARAVPGFSVMSTRCQTAAEQHQCSVHRGPGVGIGAMSAENVELRHAESGAPGIRQQDSTTPRAGRVGQRDGRPALRAGSASRDVAAEGVERPTRVPGRPCRCAVSRSWPWQTTPARRRTSPASSPSCPANAWRCRLVTRSTHRPRR